MDYTPSLDTPGPGRAHQFDAQEAVAMPSAETQGQKLDPQVTAALSAVGVFMLFMITFAMLFLLHRRVKKYNIVNNAPTRTNTNNAIPMTNSSPAPGIYIFTGTYNPSGQMFVRTVTAADIEGFQYVNPQGHSTYDSSLAEQ
ncbi:hypothetical protein K458DRAFT_436939 [Lentithecium fluviatile CBS 122367]|uniref:Uncharacterized protein n=1 Tax=Lentithecium fluviatile CBS 122367 TaxID=1168545 RepID=A0A6G1IFY3_9PLEO|nr:hypothetical protein K458DRAFT_436939 [Lentithecium fluviatile CBS 122367]